MSLQPSFSLFESTTPAQGTQPALHEQLQEQFPPHTQPQPQAQSQPKPKSQPQAPATPMVPINLSTLNPQQREAVTCTKGPLLVLAGAGSGKTRVLTHRIAYIIQHEQVQPWRILAITFTNKAAKEMRERLEMLLSETMRGMWVCTFHAMCSRILREHADVLGYTSNFVVYDDSDSKRLVKTIMDDLNLDTKKLSINALRARISAAKNAAKTCDDLEREAQGSYVMEAAAKVYRELNSRLLRANAMDFDDLLLNTLTLFVQHPDVLASYQQRFLYVSVDEYQDTNGVQYALTNLLAKTHHNLMVVGDDDQSIYSWRGADITNILSFRHDYPEAKVVKLEQNYRSTAHILHAANAVVKHNEHREEKELFTKAGSGERVEVFQASDERDEGRWIGGEIEKLHDNGMSYQDIAVFYRTNAQSRILEDMFLRAGVPYSIVGGTRFFDRAEIRNVMAYLRVVVNPADDVSLLRIINTPRRGIGTTTLQRLQAYAQSLQCSLFAAIKDACLRGGVVAARATSQLQQFVDCVDQAQRMSGEFSEVIRAIIESTHMIEALEAENTMEAQSRIENIQEFYSVAAEFDLTHEDAQETLESLQQLRDAGVIAEGELESVDAGSAESSVDVALEAAPGTDAASAPASQNDTQVQLAAFMEWLALRSDLDTLSGETSSITMMTVHAAKGLEFDVVFVAGMEDGIFPHRSFDTEDSNIEEERRLAYVAITRARKRLFLSYATTRHMFGSVQTNPKSRFLREIPDEDMHTTGVGSEGFAGVGWEKRGDRHGTFGSGRGSDVYGGNVFGSYTRSTGVRTQVPAAPQARGITRDATQAHASYKPGDRVSHKVFGVGVVQSDTGDMVTVRFSKTGKTKKLMKGFAPLVKLTE
ncbi:putative ATP-dependent DNA helicase PcrA [Fannyhessea vaginae PB189-T1-4]|uniref:DNA 3'-5' helicase n=1 Tax=Fannyhessea vaginae PB189-T1-4 TaxID=866774 RepID=A0ABN0AZ36_9ACTN|nr:putative ATP-dependent DNA helicase PcrA [Fannyhessea vaginae PB189-T1-4]